MDKNQKYTFEEVMKLDEALRQLATYDVTEGMLYVSTDIEDLNRLQINIAKRFNYFKKLIQKGSCSFEFIKQTVLEKNGPFKQPKLDKDDPDYIYKLLEQQKSFQQDSKSLNGDTKEIEQSVSPKNNINSNVSDLEQYLTKLFKYQNDYFYNKSDPGERYSNDNEDDNDDDNDDQNTSGQTSPTNS